MKLILLTALLLLTSFTANCHASVVFVIYTPNIIYIASDSLVLDDTKGRSHHLECKVQVSRDFVWAAVGVSEARMLSYNIDQIARETLVDGTDFTTATSNFERELGKRFLPVRRMMMHAGESSLTSSVTVTVLSTKLPTARAADINIESTLHTKICSGDSCGKSKYWIDGENIESRKILAADPYIWEKMRMVDLINKLITAEEQAHPDVVGGPISIGVVNAAGFHWAQHGVCKP